MGQPPVSFQQFSGYITVDKAQQRALFYYFVEAEADDKNSKPLVLWLNGGPGCSSIGAGAFCEHGPFKPSGDILLKNNYSWNKEANMLYLESPAGVGFSYSTNSSFSNHINDELTARDNLAFLERWFDKFPKYKSRDFFITSESYGGHYVPQLAELIVKSRAKFNFKGIALGNPLLEFETDWNSRGEYLWSHGLISDSTYEGITKNCSYAQYIREQIRGKLSLVCSGVSEKVLSEIGSSVDQYDVTLDVCLSLTALSQSKMLDIMQDKEEVDVCVERETTKYLNRKDVQKALHARLVGVAKWSVCGGTPSYDMKNLEIPTIGILGTLVRSGIRVLAYSGDQDSIMPLIGTRKLINRLAKDLGLNTTVSYRAWFAGKQVGGWTQVYGDKLSFATIRGAAHEAPLSQPKRSLQLFHSFLAGKPLPEKN
ncbi:hypothetical protein ACFE04_030420 [Oxalis oulophora]